MLLGRQIPIVARRENVVGSLPIFCPGALTVTIQSLINIRAKPLTPIVPLKEALEAEFKASRVVLVLGSGVSRPFGLPDWPTLLRRIVERMHPATSIQDALLETQANPLILARYIRESFPDKSSFNTIVHQTLYENYKDDFSNQFFRAAIKFIETSIETGGPRYVLTYNFDTILERWLEKFAVGLPSFASDWKTRPSDQSAIEVFHCHGIMPFDVNEAANKNLVFDETEYHGVYYDHYNVSNIMQVSAFSEKTCLFCGISLTDPNMRRLLDYTASKRPDRTPHFMFRKIPNEPVDIQNELVSLFERDAKSLGVNTIWVHDYDEIPKTIMSSIGQ
jgi:hypothetical protein